MTRYTRSHGYHNVMRSHRYRPILIILLVLLAAFLIFKAAGVGGINEGNYEAQRNTRLRSEVQHAVSSVNSLSRLGASSTSAMLGRIRQYVHGVEAVSYTHLDVYKRQLQGRVTYVGNTSMEVCVDTYVEHLECPHDRTRVNRAYLTMVAIGADGRPARVPALVPETSAERADFEAGKERRAQRRREKKD